MSLNYGIGLDTSQMERDAQRANLLFKNIGDKAQIEASRINMQFKNTFAFAGGAAAASSFVSQLVNVRGEFQQLEIAFTTMLKSKEKSDKLMQNITEFAATTPFDLKQVAAGTKQLLAYGFAANDITQNLSMIGNVASGVGSQIGDLIYLYGTLKASGRVTQMDINQFAGRGIPIYEELARVLGVNRDQVRSFVSEGKVGFEQVEKAFKGMTGEGGIFYNLMQNQSKSITGQLSNLGDAVDKMFNQIGESSQDTITGAIGAAQSLVANYETVGKVIGGLVATYGTYKAAVMVLTVVQKANTLIQLESALAGRALTTSQGLQAIATKQLTIAQSMLNKTMLANPYVLAATAVVGLVAITWALSDSSTAAEKAQSSLNDRIEQQKSIIDKGVQAIKDNIEVIKNETSTQKEKLDALIELQRIYPAMFNNLDIEKIKTIELTDAVKGYKQAREDMFQRSDKKDLNEINYLLSSANKTDTTTTWKPQDKEKVKSALGDKAKWYMGGNDLYELLKIEQKALSTKIDKETKTENASKFVSGISGFSDSQLESEIKKREALIYKIGNKKSVGKINGLGVFSKDEINTQLSALSTEMSKRKEKKYTGSEEISEENKKLKKLMKERAEIISAKLTPADRKKQLEDKDVEIKAVEDKIKLLSNKSSKDRAKEINDAKKTAQEKADFDLKIKNDTIKSGFDLKQVELDKQNAVTSAMKEGYAKQRQLIEDEHNQKLLDIERKTQELIEKQQEVEREEWHKNGSKGTFKPTTTSASQLNTTNSSIVGSMTETVNIQYKSDTTNLLKSLNETYASFDERRREIDEKFNSDEGVLKSEFSGAELEVRLKELALQYKTAIQQINSEEVDLIYGTSDLIVQLFSEASTKSISELKKIASEASSLYSYLSKTKSEDLADTEIGGKKFTKSELTSMKSDKGFMSDLKNRTTEVSDIASNADLVFGGFGASIKKVFDSFKSGDKSVEGTKNKIDALSAAFGTLQSFGNQAVGLLQAMSKEEGDAASSAANSISAVMDIAGSTLQGFQQGGIIGGAIAFVTSVATKIFESEKAHQAALKKIQDEKIAQQKEYNDSLMKQNDLLKNAETIFGTDKYGQAIGYASVADKFRNASNKANANLSGATVQTGSHKTGLFGWGGEKADYSGLLSVYPALIDGQGKLNKELAQSILDNQTLNDESKKALQTAIDYSAEYEEALKSISDYLNSVFGSLGSDMMTAITDNLGDTKSALNDFADSAAGTIEKLMTDIAYSMFFADKFKKLSDDVLAVQKNTGLTPEQKAAKETELLGQFYSNIGAEVDSANKFLQDSKDAAAKAGFDLWDNTTRTGASKGIAQASQDSVDELNGRMTTIQGHTFMINESAASIKTDMSFMRENAAQSLRHLAGIETNTSRLEAVENAVVGIKAGIDNINLKGVKLQ